MTQRAVQRGAGAGLVAAGGGHHRVHRGGDGRPGAEPAQCQPGRHDGVPGGQVDLAEHGQSRCQQRQPGGHCEPGAGCPRGQAGRAARDEQAAHQRQQPQSRADRVIAGHALQVLGNHEHDPEQAAHLILIPTEEPLATTAVEQAAR